MAKSRKVAVIEQNIVRNLPEIRWDRRLTNSARTTFWNCRKKFELGYLRRLSPRSVNIPFLVGGLFHSELEIMYTSKGFDERAARKRVTEEIEKKCMSLSITPEQSDKVWIQRAIVMGLIRGYAKHYLKDDLAKWKIIECEVIFKFPLPRKYTSTGKRDMLVAEKKKLKVLILVEHKTASRIDSGYVAKLPLDSQILGYALSVKKETGKIPGRILYNIAKKSQLRQKETETFDDYSKRVESEYLDFPEKYFYRESLTFTEADIKNYEIELQRFIKEIDRAIDEGYFYKNTTHCTQYGICEFMPICVNGPTEDVLSRYKERTVIHPELDGEDEDENS